MVRVNGSAELARRRPGLATHEAGLPLLVAAGAWAATVALARGMTGLTGTMGLGLAVFVPVWTLMVAAMMLPSVAPTASLYGKTVANEPDGEDHRAGGGLSRGLGGGPGCPPTGWPGSPAG